MFTVTVGGKTGRRCEPFLTAGNDGKHPGTRCRTNDLRHDIRKEFSPLEPFAHQKANGDGRVQVTPGNVADGVSHG